MHLAVTSMAVDAIIGVAAVDKFGVKAAGGRDAFATDVRDKFGAAIATTLSVRPMYPRPAASDHCGRCASVWPKQDATQIAVCRFCPQIERINTCQP